MGEKSSTSHARTGLPTRPSPFHSMSCKINACALALLSVGCFSNYAADNDSGDSKYLPWEKGSVKIGGFISAFDSTLTFGRPGSGATFNAEDRLGLDSNLAVLRADV